MQSRKYCPPSWIALALLGTRMQPKSALRHNVLTSNSENAYALLSRRPHRHTFTKDTLFAANYCVQQRSDSHFSSTLFKTLGGEKALLRLPHPWVPPWLSLANFEEEACICVDVASGRLILASTMQQAKTSLIKSGWVDSVCGQSAKLREGSI